MAQRNSSIVSADEQKDSMPEENPFMPSPELRLRQLRVIKSTAKDQQPNLKFQKSSVSPPGQRPTLDPFPAPTIRHNAQSMRVLPVRYETRLAMGDDNED